MGNLPPEELSREIERLWSRLGSAASEPSAPPSALPSAGGAELAWETVALLEGRRRRSESAMSSALEAKEQALKHWRARAEALQAESAELRSRVDASEEHVFAELLDAQRRLEDAVRAQQDERAKFDEERRRGEAALEEARERITAEAARAREAEARWTKREAQSLLDLKDVQASAERRQKEAADAEENVRALKGGMAEAKNAIEKTLAELLLERQERARVEEERERALKKTDELQLHFDELQKLWDEERAQWRELWDRERSTWEAQRQELAQWEETLRREREAWHAELQDKEKAQLAYTDSLTGKIRETSAVAEQVAERMKRLETHEERDRVQSAGRLWGIRAKRGLALCLGALALAAAARPAWRWAGAWRYAPEAAAPVSAANPTALAFDGRLLWVSDWSGRLTALDPADPRRAEREVAAPAAGPKGWAAGPYRPTALAFGGGSLWTLDAAQARLLRLASPASQWPASGPSLSVIASYPAPGPAPTALAFDGDSLWSYDAANRALYRHGKDEATHKAYAIAEDVVPNALAWVDGRLWMHDTKSRRIFVYAVVAERLVLRESHPAPDAALLGFVVISGKDGRRLWALVGPSAERGSSALAVFRLRRRIPFS